MTTRTRRSSGSWTADTPSRQITELAQAFRGFAQSVPGLTVEVVGHVAGHRQYVHPVAGFHVRLRGGDDGGIELYVSSRYGELVRWRPGTGALRERFDVHIDEPGYGWGESTFPTAHELAHDLVAYMQFNLDALRKN
ncbi:MAG: hypothetical protein WEF86_05255 [Gemmatimonadota bacterium]